MTLRRMRLIRVNRDDCRPASPQQTGSCFPGTPYVFLQAAFFCDEDHGAYLEIMTGWCGRCSVEIWACCLMPNHVHLIGVPETEDALWLAIENRYAVTGICRNSPYAARGGLTFPLEPFPLILSP
ncbi:MAG: transposase [Deltaproteobacteria bacterium]|nr:transposase [Deltaproteobacteria bacterium]MBW2308254.1 transposase [Deltaproteobacteria bacterium]